MLNKVLLGLIIIVAVLIVLKESERKSEVLQGFDLEPKEYKNLTTQEQGNEVLNYGKYIYKDNAYFGWLIFIIFVVIVGKMYEMSQRR